jgi:hypothetical protein
MKILNIFREIVKTMLKQYARINKKSPQIMDTN